MLLAQSPAPDASTIFYLTLLFIFVTAIITTIATKWSRDKCLKFFRTYHITIERNRGATMWGRLNVFSSGIEILYDHPYIDPMGRKKTSSLFYQSDLDTQLLSILRYHGELTPQAQKQRFRQVNATFNPGFFRRTWRGIRNLFNTLRDAFNAAIGAAVTQFQRVNPILASQSGAVTQMGQTLLGKFANAYEPLLEQYIGHPVILEVADPINPNNAVQEYPGYLADYTQNFIALFNVDHAEGDSLTLDLPDSDRGEPLPPLPPPPPPGAPAPILPPPLSVQHDIAIRLDGPRLKIQNLRPEPLAIRRLERDGFEPLEIGMVLPPMGTLNLPARDARGGQLLATTVRSLDIVAPRRFATVRHAGELLDRKSLANEFALDRLPLVSKLFSDSTHEKPQPHQPLPKPKK